MALPEPVAGRPHSRHALRRGRGAAPAQHVAERRHRRRAPFPADTIHDAERELHRRTLSRVLAATGAVATVLCATDAALSQTMRPSAALFALGIACLLAFELNRRDRYYPASAVFVGAALLVTTFIMIVGDGLRDAGLLAVPVVIVAGTLLYGRRAAFPLFLLALAAVAAVALYGRPAIVPGEERLTTRLISIVVILAATARFMRVMTDDTERHRQRVARSQAELHRAYELTLEGWARILEYRDEETEGHSRRVADLAVAFARELGVDEQGVTHIRRGALLHDIGKLGVPDSILRKPGPLDDHERSIMQQHPVIAREMLATIAFLEPAMPIPYSHHERWDGQGYPLGLAGSEIPLPARLFAIVDQWEALTSDRPYRAAWPPEEALAYIRANAGTIFDPVLVEPFARVLERLAAIPGPSTRESAG